MFDGSISMSLQTPNCPPFFLSTVYINKTLSRTRPILSAVVQSSSLLGQSHESGSLHESRKFPGSAAASLLRSKSPDSLLNQANTIGIIGGVSVSSTLNFLGKLVWYSAKDAEECPPFVVCNDPALNEELFHASVHSLKSKTVQLDHIRGAVSQNLRHKRAFLEQAGARCIVMPCHISHAWHGDVSEGCSIPFLHVGECVAKELKEAKLKPLEAGSGVRIGVLATDATLSAGFYQEKLQNQGFEVVLPDKATMEHVIIPTIEALNHRDMEGARNLLRIGIQLLLVRAVNAVIIGSDEMQGVLPKDDPLLKKCIDPMDALARSTVTWARSNKKVRNTT
ncbi:Aspartate-glutamate racemase family [Citrus sinensis]|uniref:Aspartate-glutamate racemase family n=4 Tax=Citrus TaxID=2706 RepID=A0ACB8NSE6_CITSI|nr:hypothetical protein CICLE_v10008863mg [Citrus x clementina]KAH9761905.1 Aspartate-glutamate racemase family [Citrus sinensis]KAH9800305.1 Aspartate-glutamate racemase family [Citrus sinensis]KDO80297.1 hypothetical protein CISIN_1g017159mg [Citrus sinensis]GAY50584.1 hypothetical protein CUMW_127800 [Citrus unshiu]